MASFKPTPTHHAIRRAASVLALAGVLVSSLGIMFVPVPQRDSTQAFPCQGGSCGCTSAAACWQNCCCTTVAERLAWANLNDVTPPSFLVELLAVSPERPAVTKTKTCCSHETADASAVACTERIESPTRMVLISDLGRCRGLAKYIAIFGNAICEPLPENSAYESLAISWLRAADESLESARPSPPTPPPRVAG